MHTMPSAAFLGGARKRHSVCEQTLADDIIRTLMPLAIAEFGRSIPMSLTTYIVELNKINNEDQGQAGQVT